MNVRNTMLFPAILFLAAGCSAADSTLSSSDVTDLTASAARATAVSTVRIDPANASVAVDSTVKLGSYLYDAQGKRVNGLAGMIVRWVSSDTTVATVGSNGQVRGLRNGAVTIRVVAGTVSGDSHVTVGSGASATITPPLTSPPTTATSTTTTSSPSSSTGPGLSGQAFVWDDFRNYRSTSDLMLMVSSNIGGLAAPSTALYNDGANANLAGIDNTVLYNGHSTMKYTQPGGVANTPELWVSFPNNKTVTKFWFRAKLRWSPGYTTDGVTPNYGKGYKVFGWGWAGANGRGSLELGSINQYYTVWAVFAAVNSGTPDMIAGNATTEWTDGNWYDYIILYEQTSPTTIRQRFWLTRDGQAPVLRSDQTGTMTAGTVPAVNRFMLGMNFNQQRAATQNQAIWYGQWEVVDASQNPNPFGLAGTF